MSTATATTDELSPALAQAVRRLRDIAANIEELTAAANEIKGRLRAELRAGTYSAGGAKVLTVRPPSHRFDPKLATEVLPGELLALCTVNKVDPATAKAVLPPVLYAACSPAVGEPVVSVL
jgi:hypothetical protein